MSVVDFEFLELDDVFKIFDSRRKEFTFFYLQRSTRIFQTD